MHILVPRLPWHRVNGLLVPDFVNQENVDKLGLELYPDDVWVVTYPKSGTTWTQQIVRLSCIVSTTGKNPTYRAVLRGKGTGGLEARVLYPEVPF